MTVSTWLPKLQFCKPYSRGLYGSIKNSCLRFHNGEIVNRLVTCLPLYMWFTPPGSFLRSSYTLIDWVYTVFAFPKVPSLAPSTSLGNLQEMQILRPHSRPVNQKLWRAGPAACVLTRLPGDSGAWSSLRVTGVYERKITRKDWGPILQSQNYTLKRRSFIHCVPQWIRGHHKPFVPTAQRYLHSSSAPRSSSDLAQMTQSTAVERYGIISPRRRWQENHETTPHTQQVSVPWRFEPTDNS